MLDPKIVKNLFCEHLDNKIDILTTVVNKLHTEGIRTAYVCSDAALGLNENIDELYPADIIRTYEVRNPVKEGVEWICGKFNNMLGRLQFLQSGMMQSYLWISVLFLVLAILYAIFSSSSTEVLK